MATTPGTIKHRHHSVLPAGTSDVDVSQWNDSEVVAGGTTGDALVRDTTQTDGWGWTPLNIYQVAGSGQITFPATAVPSSNPNVLDDYEEGPFTPIITADGGASGQTYSQQNGIYTKVGRLMSCQYVVQLTNKGTLTGNVQLAGFPMLGGTLGFSAGVFAVAWTALATAYAGLWIGTLTAGGVAYLRPIAVSGATDAFGATLATANLTNTSGFYGVLQYPIT